MKGQQQVRQMPANNTSYSLSITTAPLYEPQHSTIQYPILCNNSSDALVQAVREMGVSEGTGRVSDGLPISFGGAQRYLHTPAMLLRQAADSQSPPIPHDTRPVHWTSTSPTFKETPVPSAATSPSLNSQTCPNLITQPTALRRRGRSPRTSPRCVFICPHSSASEGELADYSSEEELFAPRSRRNSPTKNFTSSSARVPGRALDSASRSPTKRQQLVGRDFPDDGRSGNVPKYSISGPPRSPCRSGSPRKLEAVVVVSDDDHGEDVLPPMNVTIRSPSRRPISPVKQTSSSQIITNNVSSRFVSREPSPSKMASLQILPSKVSAQRASPTKPNAKQTSSTEAFGPPKLSASAAHEVPMLATAGMPFSAVVGKHMANFSYAVPPAYTLVDGYVSEEEDDRYKGKWYAVTVGREIGVMRDW